MIGAAPRVTSAQRIQMAGVAEAAIMRYAMPDHATGIRPHALWHKYVHNVVLDPVQCLKMAEMDEHAQTIDFSCRRTGKTAVKEMYCLEEVATKPYQTEGIVAPREAQSITNLSYHLDAIARSPMLAAYIHHKNGRPQKTDTYYQFANLSGAVCYGIMGAIDGDSLTIASLEETDDMPQDRLMSRFLPMLGSARRLGASSAIKLSPQVRITGVFKGAGVVQALIDMGVYHILPIVDIHLGIELGILNAAYMLDMQRQMTAEEYMRQFICRNIEAQNHIWEKHLRRAIAKGLAANLQVACPLPGEKYRKRGLLAFGYDHTGHGEQPHASKSALVVTELVANHITFPFIKSWPPGTDDKVIERDLIALWEYFDPDCALGDAYGVGMLTNLNDQLYRRGLTHINRLTIGDGESTASTWREWAFAPIRFDGPTKHVMASNLRSAIHSGRAAIAYVPEAAPAFEREGPAISHIGSAAVVDKEMAAEYQTFIRQLINIKAVPGKATYASYQMADNRLGDDYFDAAMASVDCLLQRAELPEAHVGIGTRTRAELLARPALSGALLQSRMDQLMRLQ